MGWAWGRLRGVAQLRRVCCAVGLAGAVRLVSDLLPRSLRLLRPARLPGAHVVSDSIPACTGPRDPAERVPQTWRSGSRSGSARSCSAASRPRSLAVSLDQPGRSSSRRRYGRTSRCVASLRTAAQTERRTEHSWKPSHGCSTCCAGRSRHRAVNAPKECILLACHGRVGFGAGGVLTTRQGERALLHSRSPALTSYLLAHVTMTSNLEHYCS